MYDAHELPTICPFCDQHHDVASTIRGNIEPPNDGDITLCWRCGEFCVFDRAAPGGLRKPTNKEARGFRRDDELQELITAWKIIKQQ